VARGDEPERAPEGEAVTRAARISVDRLLWQRADLLARRLSELAAEGKALSVDEVRFQADVLRPIWSKGATGVALALHRRGMGDV